MNIEDDKPKLKTYSNDADLVSRMTNVCQAAFAFQESLHDEDAAELTAELGEPFFDLVLALSVLYEGCEVEFDEEMMDS